MTPLPVRLVIFDCDGVLVDSEGTASRVVSRAVSDIGWPITPLQSLQHFMGMTLGGMVPVIERHLGRPVPPGWGERLRLDMLRALSDEVAPMPGAAEAIRDVRALGLPVRVASNSSHEEMRVKFARCGLDALLSGRVHSARDVPAGKPSPDVYLLAARMEGVAPAACLVVEDSVPGTQAAIAAGMACLGLAPHGDGADLRALGARVIRSLSEVAPIARAAMRDAA